jgi:hypothetical protein
VSGTVARGAGGKLSGTWIPRGKGRPARATTYAQLQSFTLRIAIPRKQRATTRGTLVVRYLRGGGFASQTRRLAIRASR